MRRRESVSAIVGAIAVALAILVVGGAFRWTQAVVAIVLAIAVAPTLVSRRTFRQMSPLVAALLVAIVLTLLQLVPFPAAFVERLQGEGNELRTHGASLVNASQDSTLSLDVGSTLRSLCFLVILLAAAVLALRIAASEKGRYYLLAAIAGLCGVTALIVGVHELVGADSLYGLYTPRQARPSVLGPLLNENHLGSLMAIGTILGLGLAMQGSQRSRLRVMWLVIGGVCGAVTLASQSRGATLALIAGVGVTAGTLLGQRFFVDPLARRKSSFATSSLPITIVAVSALVVVLYASAGGVSVQLDRTSLDEINAPRSKMAIWRSTAALIETTPWVGVGRGAFEVSFTRFHPAAALNSFSHVENEYLQTVVDWGIPGAILLGAAGVWLIVVGFRRWRDGPLIAAALGATTAVALQSMVDFGVELLGLALPVIAVLATISYVPVTEPSKRRLVVSRVLRGALCVALVGSALLLISERTETIAEQHLALKEASESDLQHAIATHPLDYYAYARIAENKARAKDPRSVLFLNQALKLHPYHPALHLLAARLLYRSGARDQSTIEYALALRNASNMRPLLEEIGSRFSAEQAANAIPTALSTTTVVKLLLELKHDSIAMHWLEKILEQEPDDIVACEWLYASALQGEDLLAARIASQRCQKTAPNYETRVKLGRLLLKKKLYGEAAAIVADVESWTGRIDVRASGWLVACDVFIEQKLWDEAKRCVRRLDAAGIVLPASRAEVLHRLDAIEEGMRATPP